ncbi:MAG: hypothetical protein ACOWWH_08210 [Eubacteriaceae bacterium]
MISHNSLTIYLKSLLLVLKDEKESLINNNVEKIIRLIDTKNEYIDKISKFEETDFENNVEIRELIKQINLLQETNMLLTKQALSFQSSLLQVISKNIQNNSNTYTSKGKKYQNQKELSFINESV